MERVRGREDGLLQCPFCRLNDLEVDEYGIRCKTCGVEMPEDNGEFCDTDCGTRWNTRNGVQLETKILSAHRGHIKRAERNKSILAQQSCGLEAAL